MTALLESIVIVGAGQAGGWCAKSLREEGFGGKITLIGNEGLRPYERPPLSKSVLAGQEAPSVCELFSEANFAQLQLEFLANDAVIQIQREDQSVVLQSGETLPYDALVLATGGQARTLPHLHGKRVHTLRSISDSLRLQKALAESQQLMVLGGGWIGLEVAATAAKQGLDVTLLEREERLCARSVPPILSVFLLDLHQRHGVNVCLGAEAEDWEVSERHVHVRLQSGATLQADQLLVGVGLVPEIKLAEQAGLHLENGIAVDSHWRTSDENIFAIGDAAYRHHGGKRLRLESWANAMHSATAVAKILLHKDPIAEEIPWFWSDQHGVNIQIVGIPERWEAPILRGNVQDEGFSIFFEEGGFLTAAIALNQPNNIRVAKRLMSRKKPVLRAQLADPAMNLKTLLK